MRACTGNIEKEASWRRFGRNLDRITSVLYLALITWAAIVYYYQEENLTLAVIVFMIGFVLLILAAVGGAREKKNPRNVTPMPQVVGGPRRNAGSHE